MRKHCRVDQFRVKDGPLKTDFSFGNTGAFMIPYPGGKIILCCIAHDGEGVGWEHVSVTVRTPEGLPVKRTPDWDEMCFVKKTFWHENETVVQFHPDENLYVNVHPFCLHLWKQKGKSFELPPKDYVG